MKVPARRRNGSPSSIAWCAALLALSWTGTGAAADRIRIEIDGVDRAVADNVRGYLTLGRYLDRDDVADSQVRRLANQEKTEEALQAIDALEQAHSQRTKPRAIQFRQVFR